MLESIAPPYTPEFVQLFLPMVENEEITGTMSATGDCDLVSDFIGKSLIEAFLWISIEFYFWFFSLLQGQLRHYITRNRRLHFKYSSIFVLY